MVGWSLNKDHMNVGISSYLPNYLLSQLLKADPKGGKNVTYELKKSMAENNTIIYSFMTNNRKMSIKLKGANLKNIIYL